LDEANLTLMDSIAYEYHRPLEFGEPMVFHREQAEVYRSLMNGDNIILSAPTSFGKSRVIDAVIASRRYKNIVVVVPTIALIDETRRRLSRFSPYFKIVTQVSQNPGDRNIFVFTAERANVYEEFPRVDFFVIDEFYKIGAVDVDQKRTVALNNAFYKLSNGGGQFYLLGPCVRQIPEGLEKRFRCRFFPTTYSTVASDLIRVKKTGSDLSTLCELVRKIQGEPTLIFCKSPKSANEIAKALLDSGSTGITHGEDSAAFWMEQNFHSEWVLPRSLKKNIGMHHGKLPRSLGQYVVRAFNDGRINVLICTSTLIEGVNTKAKNVIIFDNSIAKEKLDFFTFNNIKGRSGRMFEHFVGRVFLFHEPPEEELPFVDFPVFSQGEDMPDSILLQLNDEDLSPRSRARLKPFSQQTDLPMDLLKIHSSIEPEKLLSLARYIKTASIQQRKLLSWTGYPTWENLKEVCVLAWAHLLSGRGQSGVFSGAQLALKISKLRETPDIRRRILDELVPGKYAAKTVDEAVERVLEFERTWASFELPRILRAFSDIRGFVVGGSGDYSFFAGKLENLFRPSFQVALEEFGVPLQISDKLNKSLLNSESIDDALAAIKSLEVSSLDLGQFEKEMIRDCQDAL
jgi:Helicase conserved C-terminal domain/DEAD/DEAH box helicase